MVSSSSNLGSEICRVSDLGHCMSRYVLSLEELGTAPTRPPGKGWRTLAQTLGLRGVLNRSPLRVVDVLDAAGWGEATESSDEGAPRAVFTRCKVHEVPFRCIMRS